MLQDSTKTSSGIGRSGSDCEASQTQRAENPTGAYILKNGLQIISKDFFKEMVRNTPYPLIIKGISRNSHL